MSCNNCEIDLFNGILQFATDDAILELYYNHGMLLRSKDCPICGRTCVKSGTYFRCQKTWRISIRDGREFETTKCNFRKSIFHKTWLERSQLALQQNFRFMMMWLQTNASREELIFNNVGISKQTIVDWSMFCREVCIYACHSSTVRLGGEGIIVEIDEAKFGKRKYNRGRIVDGVWVFGGIERFTGNSFMVAVPDRSSATLLGIIRDRILPGKTIISDCWRAYDCLAHHGFQHLRVNHSLNFVDPTTGAHTQNIERTWREVRDNIPTYGRREEHMEGYLAEYYFKKKYSVRLRMHYFMNFISELYNPSSG